MTRMARPIGTVIHWALPVSASAANVSHEEQARTGASIWTHTTRSAAADSRSLQRGDREGRNEQCRVRAEQGDADGGCRGQRPRLDEDADPRLRRPGGHQQQQRAQRGGD